VHVKKVGLQRTDLAHHLIVLQLPPSDVHAVIVPVRPWHLLVDIGIDARHVEVAARLSKAQVRIGGGRGVAGSRGVVTVEADVEGTKATRLHQSIKNAPEVVVDCG